MCVFEDVFGHLWNHLAAILSPTSLSFTGLGRSIRTCYIFSGVHAFESSGLQFRARPAGGGVDQREMNVRE